MDLCFPSKPGLDANGTQLTWVETSASAAYSTGLFRVRFETTSPRTYEPTRPRPIFLLLHGRNIFANPQHDPSTEKRRNSRLLSQLRGISSVRVTHVEGPSVVLFLLRQLLCTSPIICPGILGQARRIFVLTCPRQKRAFSHRASCTTNIPRPSCYSSLSFHLL